MVYGINPPSKTYMKQFIYTFQAESLKLKYSGIPRTAYILALIMPLIGIGMSIFSFFETEAPPTAPVYPFYQIYDQLIKDRKSTRLLQSRPHLVCRLLLEKKKY